MSYLFHEIGHLVDFQLTEAERSLLDNAVSGGLDWHDNYHNDYQERRARLIQHYCMYLMEGGFAYAPPGTSADLLSRIYSGEVGGRIMARLDRQRDPVIARRAALALAA